MGVTSLIAVSVFTGIVLATVFAPFIVSSAPAFANLADANSPPSSGYWLGTDALGRDILSRLLYGGRISLGIGLGSVLAYLPIGVALGAVAGYFGGWLDATIMRLADVTLSFPSLLIILNLVAILGPSAGNIVIAIGVLGWPKVVRLVRAEVLTLKERDFIQANVSLGANPARTILKHLLPNALAPIVVVATFGVAQAILLEAALSFLGLGIQPPTPSWGNMLQDAENLHVLRTRPWQWLPPGIMISTTVLSITFIADGLKEATDPSGGG